MTTGCGAAGRSGCRQRPLYGTRSIGATGSEVVASAGRPAAPRPATGPASRLNPRDVELLRHLAAGRSTAQTATAMSLTTNTVRTRIRRIQAKLSAPDRPAAVRLAREHGIV